MPTYEYACKSCGEHLEVVQSFRDDALTECPACGGKLRKVFGNIGIAFKGSGFYKTDSRPAAASSGSDKSSAESSSDSSSSDKSAGPGKSAESAKSAGSTKSTDTDSAKPKATTASAKEAS
jgi:putative FmdB family regulatory protein